MALFFKAHYLESIDKAMIKGLIIVIISYLFMTMLVGGQHGLLL